MFTVEVRRSLTSSGVGMRALEMVYGVSRNEFYRWQQKMSQERMVGTPEGGREVHISRCFRTKPYGLGKGYQESWFEDMSPIRRSQLARALAQGRSVLELPDVIEERRKTGLVSWKDLADPLSVESLKHQRKGMDPVEALRNLFLRVPEGKVLSAHARREALRLIGGTTASEQTMIKALLADAEMESRMRGTEEAEFGPPKPQSMADKVRRVRDILRAVGAAVSFRAVRASFGEVYSREEMVGMLKAESGDAASDVALEEEFKKRRLDQARLDAEEKRGKGRKSEVDG